MFFTETRKERILISRSRRNKIHLHCPMFHPLKRIFGLENTFESRFHIWVEPIERGGEPLSSSVRHLIECFKN